MCFKKVVWLAFVLISGCAQEKSATRSAVWNLKTPNLYSPSTGSTRSLDQLKESELKALVTDDILTFGEGPDQYIQMTVHTECRLNENRLTFNATFPLPEQLTVVQVLPPQVWLKKDSAATCTLQFTAKGPNGSLHMFDLSNMPINPLQMPPNLTIIGLSKTKAVFRNRLYENFFTSELKQTYEQICESNTSVIAGDNHSTRLSDFTPTTSPQPGETCRILGRNSDGRYVAFSETFRIFDKEPLINVDNRAQDRLAYDIRETSLTMQSWTLKLAGTEPSYLVLPAVHEEKLTLITVWNAQTPLAIKLVVPVDWNSGARNQNGDLVLKMLPQTQYTINLQTNGRINCSNGIAHGWWVKAPADATYIAKIVADPEKPADAMNTIAEVQLNLVPDRWVGRKPIYHYSQVQPETGPADSFSTLPLSGPLIKNHVCRHEK